MRRLLIAALSPWLALAPAFAGDLGLYDEWLTGVNATATNESKRIFDAALGEIILTPEKLTFTINPNSRGTKTALSGRLERFLDASEQGFLYPGQVLSYHYFFSGGATYFTILYKSRAGDKSTAVVGFSDQNTAMSFHKNFLAWWNGKLP